MSQRSDILNYLLNKYEQLNELAHKAHNEMIRYHPKSETWNEYESQWKSAILQQGFIHEMLEELNLSYLLRVVR